MAENHRDHRPERRVPLSSHRLMVDTTNITTGDFDKTKDTHLQISDL